MRPSSVVAITPRPRLICVVNGRGRTRIKSGTARCFTYGHRSGYGSTEGARSIEVCSVIDAHAEAIDELAAEPAGEHRQRGRRRGEDDRQRIRPQRIIAPQEPAG